MQGLIPNPACCNVEDYLCPECSAAVRNAEADDILDTPTVNDFGDPAFDRSGGGGRGDNPGGQYGQAPPVRKSSGLGRVVRQPVLDDDGDILPDTFLQFDGRGLADVKRQGPVDEEEEDENEEDAIERESRRRVTGLGSSFAVENSDDVLPDPSPSVPGMIAAF